MGLPFPREDCNLSFTNAFGFRDERTAIARVPACGRSNRPNASYVQNIAQGAKAPQRIECCIDGVDGQQPGRLHLTPKAREWLGRVGYDPVYGARPLKRAVQKYLQDPLADAILSGAVKDGDTVRVDEGDGQLVLEPASDVREAAE